MPKEKALAQSPAEGSDYHYTCFPGIYTDILITPMNRFNLIPPSPSITLKTMTIFKFIVTAIYR